MPVVAHRSIAATAAALALALAGCGSADDASLQTVPTTPAATTTVPAPRAEPAPASTRPAPPASPSGSGGSQAPDNSGGTPIQRSQRDFERYCETHPRACEN